MLRNQLKHQVEIVADLGDIPPIQCWPAKLNQVFANLIVNASQAMTEPGKVYITTRLSGPLIEIEISDDGPGIPDGDITNVFSPFFTTKPTGEGTGLGQGKSSLVCMRTRQRSITGITPSPSP